MQTDAIKDYVKFNVLGLDVDVSSEDEEELNDLKTEKKFIEDKLKPNQVILEGYNSKTIIGIFNGLKVRQGAKTHLTFMSTKNIPVEIDGAEFKDARVLLSCHLCKYQKKFKMWLTTFLTDFKANKITKVKPDGFVNAYLIKADERLNAVNGRIAEIENKYNGLYKAKEAELKAASDSELSKTPKLIKEAKKRKEIIGLDAANVAKKFKGVDITKDYWNSKLTADEKAYVMGWLASHIYSARVYGLINGQSGNTLSDKYSDIGEVKYRNPEYNDDGKLTSQDSIVAHISLKNIDGAPVELLKKICSNKRSEDFFYHNRLNDKNLALFLLAEYGKYGFKAGESKLSSKIDLIGLRDDCFAAQEDSFNDGCGIPW